MEDIEDLDDGDQPNEKLRNNNNDNNNNNRNSVDEHAAVKIQALYRGHQTRKETE